MFSKPVENKMGNDSVFKFFQHGTGMLAPVLRGRPTRHHCSHL